jgi:hypothetical protein
MHSEQCLLELDLTLCYRTKRGKNVESTKHGSFNSDIIPGATGQSFSDGIFRYVKGPREILGRRFSVWKDDLDDLVIPDFIYSNSQMELF